MTSEFYRIQVRRNRKWVELRFNYPTLKEARDKGMLAGRAEHARIVKVFELRKVVK